MVKHSIGYSTSSGRIVVFSSSITHLLPLIRIEGLCVLRSDITSPLAITFLNCLHTNVSRTDPPLNNGKSSLNIYHKVIAYRVLGTLACVAGISFSIPRRRDQANKRVSERNKVKNKMERNLFSLTKFRAAIRHFFPAQSSCLQIWFPLFASYAAYTWT